MVEGRSSTGSDTPGCLPVLAGVVMVQGGIVIMASGLHALLLKKMDASMAGVSLAGLLLVFSAPRVIMGRRRWVRVTWGQAFAAMPDFALAATYVMAWAAPGMLADGQANMLAGLMVLEFIIIHASVMLTALPEQIGKGIDGKPPRLSKAKATLILMALYSLFALGISASMGTMWIFVLFWGLMLNKALPDLLRPAADADKRDQAHLARWGLSALMYLVLTGGSVFIPVPKLGATFSLGSGDGLWEEEPHRVLAMGALYFLSLGFFELYGGVSTVEAVVDGKAVA